MGWEDAAKGFKEIPKGQTVRQIWVNSAIYLLWGVIGVASVVYYFAYHTDTAFAKTLRSTACLWKHVQVHHMNYHMCIRAYPDFVSSVIHREGVWPECMPLVAMWDSSKFDIFVDAGANIGSCSLIMGYHNITTLAFEPNPENLLYLNRSLARNTAFPVTVYPYGLGARQATLPIYMERGNAGNSVLGTPIHTSAVASHTVRVERLDEVVPPHVHSILLKIDVQGFEEQLLDGADGLLKHHKIKAIKFEVATDWLVGHGSSPLRLFKKLSAHGFELAKDPLGRSTYSRTEFAGIRGVRDAYAFAKAGRTPPPQPHSRIS